MERVTGIGGFFFRSKDPAALARWYEDMFGVKMTPRTTMHRLGDKKQGRRRKKKKEEERKKEEEEKKKTTVFEPFKQDTTFFGDLSLQWMINFRVRDLAAMVAQLQGKGIDVNVDPETYPNGRFAQLNDPEGNPIQLWQPGGKDPGMSSVAIRR